MSAKIFVVNRNYDCITVDCFTFLSFSVLIVEIKFKFIEIRILWVSFMHASQVASQVEELTKLISAPSPGPSDTSHSYNIIPGQYIFCIHISWILATVNRGILLTWRL